MRINRWFNILLVITISGTGSLVCRASTWAGASANWSSNLNPGWNGTGVPNAIGAVATFNDTPTGSATQDIVAGATVGTIEYGGSTNAVRTLTPTNAFTLNQDGAGAGTATISNSNTNSGTSNRLSIASGSFVLADDLLITNTGNSSNTSGSITFASGSVLSGTGNLTVRNVSNSLTTAMIVLGANSTFVGSVLIEKGAVTFGNNTGFGDATNAITIGSAGNSASVISTGSTTNLANNLTIAATTGTNLLGSNSGAASNSTYSGTITLNGSVTLTSSKQAGSDVRFTKVISGVGAVTKIGTGTVRFSGANTYQGGTTVSVGMLQVAAGSSLGTGNVKVDGTGGSTPILELDTATAIDNGATLTLANGGTLQLKFGNGNIESIGVLKLDGVTFNTPALFSQSSGFIVNGVDYSSYFTGSDTGTSLQVIPEPGSASLMLGAAAAGLLLRRRKGEKL